MMINFIILSYEVWLKQCFWAYIIYKITVAFNKLCPVNSDSTDSL